MTFGIFISFKGCFRYELGFVSRRILRQGERHRESAVPHSVASSILAGRCQQLHRAGGCYYATGGRRKVDSRNINECFDFKLLGKGYARCPAISITASRPWSSNSMGQSKWNSKSRQPFSILYLRCMLCKSFALLFSFNLILQVDSALVTIDFTKPHKDLRSVSGDKLRKVVSTAFRQRRKMLRQSLKGWRKIFIFFPLIIKIFTNLLRDFRNVVGGWVEVGR